MLNKISIVLFCLYFSACFKVRNVEPPDNLGSTWQPPTSPDLLVSNFRMAMQTGNTQNYVRCFAEGNEYRFVAAPSVVNGHESVWQNWSKTDEQTYFNNFRAAMKSTSVLGLDFKQAVTQNLSADSVNYNVLYNIEIPFSDTTKQRSFAGQLTFLLKLNNNSNNWEIRRWTDVETHTDSSWSKIKLTYLQ